MNKVNSIIIIQLIVVITNLFAQDNLKLMAVLEGSNRGDKFGIVKGAGDVNGDGFDDFLVGNTNSANYARLYLGSADFDTSNYITLTPSDSLDYNYGNRVGGLGDINNDGYDDFAIGCSHFNGMVGQGRFHVYYGGTDVDTKPDFTYTANYYKEFIGVILGQTDINQDGYDDFLVSYVYNWSTGKGRVKIFWGGEQISEENILEITATDEGDIFFGESMAMVNDLNGDNYQDLLISSNFWWFSKCKVYVYYGGPEMDNKYDEIIETENEDDYNFGSVVYAIGDSDSDNRIDFIIGSRQKMYFYDSLKVVDTLFAEDFSNVGGWGTGNIGDLNNDGHNDFVWGSLGIKDSIYTGGCFVYLDEENLPSNYSYSFIGNREDAGEMRGRFGEYFESNVDINNDGYDELLIAATTEDAERGRVYIYSLQEITDIEENKETLPSEFTLLQNFPNPFNPTTTISYQIPEQGFVTLKVYDMLGREVADLVNNKMEAGKYSVNFNASNLASGIYIYNINVQSFEASKSLYSKTEKMMLLK